MIFKPTQVTVAVETSVSQTLTALELRSLLAQLVLETAVWEQMTASHMAPQETVVNALVSVYVIILYLWMPFVSLCPINDV